MDWWPEQKKRKKKKKLSSLGYTVNLLFLFDYIFAHVLLVLFVTTRYSIHEICTRANSYRTPLDKTINQNLLLWVNQYQEPLYSLMGLEYNSMVV